jgi:NAD(P)-dependent dehydrogenase (short-subunit alcohol dehydrogenase family)
MFGSLSLDGRVAVVTGGAGGIGAETVRIMTERGARVAIADISLERAEALARHMVARGADVIALGVDLSDEASIQAMIATTAERFGRIDILHNNAAALSPELADADQDVGSMETWVWDRAFAVNCRGAMIATREALPHLIASKGCIVNTVSNLALQGHVVQAAYSASKAALVQLTRSVAASHGRKGVRCNAVAPGMTMTPALKEAFPPHIRKLVEDETLRDRLGNPEDIAEVVAFLASDAARNITGQVIVADGGLQSHVPGFAGFLALGQD